MNEEFNMYTAKVEELGTTVADQAKAYIDKIDEVTSIVNDLANYWGGPTYDTFLQTYNDKLADIQNLYDVLNDISGTLGNTASTAESMINQINDQMGV